MRKIYTIEGNIWKENDIRWYNVPEKKGGDNIQIIIAVIAVYSSNISSTKTGRKAIRMIDDADKFGGGRPGSHYVLY